MGDLGSLSLVAWSPIVRTTWWVLRMISVGTFDLTMMVERYILGMFSPQRLCSLAVPLECLEFKRVEGQCLFLLPNR